MADRLQIYRGALRLLGDGRLASLTEVNSRRVALDDAWDNSVDFMLEQGLWNFAMRTVDLSADDDFEPLYGYKYSFKKPDDWVRTRSICDEPFFTRSYDEYHDEGEFWFADIDTLYISYVSNHSEYGWNIGLWRQSFSKALETYLAFECGLPVANDKTNRNDLFQLFEKRLKNAKTKDAVDEGVVYQPAGRLVRARSGYGSRMSSRER